MKITAVMWSSYIPLLKEAAESSGVELEFFSNKQFNTHPETISAAGPAMRSSDLVLLYRTNDPFWDEIDDILDEIRGRIPVVVVGSDPSYWGRSTVNPEIVATTYRYILYNGRENFINMLNYLQNVLFGIGVKFSEPEEISWEGIFHPVMGVTFDKIDDYLKEYKRRLSFTPFIYAGVLFSRTNWLAGKLEVETELVESLERRGLGVIPVFYYSMKDKNLGNMSGAEVIETFMVKDGSPIVDGIIKLNSFFLESGRGGIEASQSERGASLMAKLGIPLFQPVISYYKSTDEWLHDPQGLGSQISWSIAMPEFEGVIEPLIIGATRSAGDPDEEAYEAIHDRIEKLTGRVEKWLRMRRKPNSEKRIAFFLNNNPCASVEATVGGGAHLDTLETVARVMHAMKDAGYNVTPPADGKELIDTIMERKAISEFRWTTSDEIVKKGGTIAMVEKNEYMEWFNELPEPTRNRLVEAWGNPPGEEKDGIPAAMLYKDKILVTGVDYGNAVVCVQPKRGCAGTRCDGQVCKILHDPDVPPPHQYIATYKWISRVYGADIIVHVGTHGNLEFLPGKGTGLSSGCMPDICIDNVPHLYIYNADNPPEGIIAKRRSNAVLVDHMQTIMAHGELYGDLEQLDRLLEEYNRYRDTEPGKAHTISHMIEKIVQTLNLLDGEEIPHGKIDEKIEDIHNRLSLLKNTSIPKGMHIFGRIPDGEKLADFIYAIVRFSDDPESLRGVILRNLKRTGDYSEDELFEKCDCIMMQACREYILNGISILEILGKHFAVQSEDKYHVMDAEKSIDKIKCDTESSDEIGSLLNGFNGNYIEPGPSGLITRGRPDILPTGRNFYALDPHRIPTPAAWEIGRLLADKTVDRYLADEGRYPENIAFYWQCNDIMWADGEGMAQMLYLLGAKPLWGRNGRVTGFDVIPLEELERPRIDLTVRVSGITRDNFPSAINLLDEAVQRVAALDEPVEANYIRKHFLDSAASSDPSLSDDEKFRNGTYRIFASMPGTYQAGTQLAVYASAWKTEEDLSDVFVYWNGYAYGKGSFGVEAHDTLKQNLKSVDATFNKTMTDEYDLTGCCCYFGAHGGLINAAKVMSGNDIQNYYGDTREPGRVSVRTLSEELRRVARGKILNPLWIEGMKEHGYKGAGEISKRVGRVYGWQATTREVDDTVFDDITRTFIMNDENRKFFEDNNPWALEEMGRRLLEAEARGLWNADPEVFDNLKNQYLNIEGWIEENMGDVEGEFQGGNVDIMTPDDVAGWGKRMEKVRK
ncbi:MAG TPA: cobaltochelatase subunit CobN [Spirochaetota bacterium]|nr:cobaltochelatase subunit CobN [Spirochaetota bacterium]HPJ35776.1 cobaltochelatase subunit CobN [Spirochaetota bacterium]